MHQKIEIKIENSMIQNYAILSNDFNPIHTTTFAANQAGFPNKVAHGMLAMAIGTKLTSNLLSDSWMIKNYKVKFIAPIYVNDTLVIKTSDLIYSDKQISLKVNGINQHKDYIIAGNITLIPFSKA